MVSLRNLVLVIALHLQAMSLVLGRSDAFLQAQRGEKGLWGYKDRHGPANWYRLRPGWRVCMTGQAQSPIHITATDMVTDKRLGKLSARYKSKMDATISNDGHALVVDLHWKSGVLKMNNVTYRPVQFHFHTPSEHVVMSQRFPLEMHLVHESEDGKLAVTAFLFVEGKASKFLAQFVDNLPSHKRVHVKRNIGKIKLLKQNRNYGRYMGSLTTPPCRENVTWTVMLWNFPTVSIRQLNLLRESVPHTNNRPTFPSDGRNFRISF